MKLESIGAGASLRAAFERFEKRGLRLARVAGAQREVYRLLSEAGEWKAEPAGLLRYGGDVMPSVGDWVAARAIAGEEAIVEAVLPRKSCFYRRAAGKREAPQAIAANIDRVFVVCGLDGDFNLRRIERYLTLAVEAQVEAVVVLNKADICADVAARAHEAASISRVPVVTLSARGGDGVGPLAPYLADSPTVALVGSSGVGKSTIANALIGGERLRTNPVREADSRGRHTTTHRELFPLAGGGALIDTPGMRELQLWASEESVGETFPEIAALAARCRFTDCSHAGEPDCAVRDALECGELSADRWESYARLKAEAHRHEALADTRVAIEDKRKLKRLMRGVRRFYEERGR